MSVAPEMPRYIMRRYRFINDYMIKKGKVHCVIALHQDGVAANAIQFVMNIPVKRISTYIDAYEEGLGLESFEPYHGKALRTLDLCRLHGTWQNVFGGDILET
jgi:hypothetical protein